MDNTEITTFGVCAGAGMLDLGCHAALEHLGIHTRALGYVERDAYAASCLVARMEEASMEPAPVWAGNLESCDVRRLHGLVDLGIAGFPCPPVSAAGQRKGIDDDRWILPAILEMFRALGTGLLLLENVGGLLSANAGREFGEVHRLLARFGYDAEWLTLRAADVGANHERNRVFILAFRPGRGLRILRESSGRNRQPERDSQDMAHAPSHGEHGEHGDTASESSTRHESKPEPIGRHDAVGDAEHAERRPEHEKHSDAHGRLGLGRPSCQLADPSSQGPQRQPNGVDKAGRKIKTRPTRPSRRELFAPGPSDPRWADIIRDEPWLAPAIAAGSVRVWWDDATRSFKTDAPESSLREFPDGMAVVVDEARADQLRVAGNGVVALQAGVAFTVLARRLMCA